MTMNLNISSEIFGDNSNNNSSLDFLTLTTVDGIKTKKSREYSLDPQDYYYCLKYIDAIKCIILAVGVPGNALTIRAFMKMGLKDCVTIAFFSLAISDLCYLIVEVGYTGMNMVIVESQYISLRDNAPRYLDTIFGVNLADLRIFAIDISDVFMAISSYLVAFLAIQRSLCVIRPLQFKHMFTRGLTWTIVSFIWMYWMTCQILQWSYYKLHKVPREGFPNDTIIKVRHHRSALRRCMKHYQHIMNFTFLPSTCVIIVLVSLFIMAHALKKSIRFRQTTSVTVAKDTSGLDKAGPNDPKKATSNKGTAVGSSKERQAIVQVTILSVFFLLAKLPESIRIIVRYTTNIAKSRHYYVFRMFYQTYTALEILNGSINFMVYYKFNSKFKEIFLLCKG